MNEMAVFKKKAPNPDVWADTVAKLAEREAKVKTLRAEGTPDSRKQLKRMMDVMYDTDPSMPSAGMSWNPDAKRHMRGSSAKCDRINSGLRAKGRVPCRG